MDRRRFLSLALLPDILPPGHKAVRHELLIARATADLPGRLVAGPLRGFGATEVRIGEPFPFSGKYGTRLHLVDRAAAVPDRWPDDALRALASADLPREVASVPVGSPVARVRTTVELDYAGGRLALRVVDEQRFDGEGRPLRVGGALWLLLVAAVGGIGLVWLRRRLPEAAA